MNSIQSHKLLFAVSLVLTAAPLIALATEPSPQIAIRFIVLTETDGTNAAASTKQIQEQVAVLRNDAARYGINIAAGQTQFVEDSALRKLPASDASRLAAHRPDSAKPDELVIYVTTLTAPDKSAATKYLLLSQDAVGRAGSARRDVDVDNAAKPSVQTAQSNADDVKALPAIVIDSKEFGGQGCGPTRATPCRGLTLALAEALSASAPQESLRRSAGEMKARMEQAIAIEP